MTIKAAIESLNSLNAYQLARMADTRCPDTLESPGAEFLTGIRRDVVERLESALEACSEEELADLAYVNFAEAFNDSDEAHEVADNAPSIWTHTRFQQLVDLCAYQEDVSELAGDETDMEKLAGIALYMVAERLVNALVSEVAEYDDEA